MTDWVRLWHDMPTDPKWRVIARKSGQPLACVIALFTLMLTEASAADERGSIARMSIEDAAAALDMDEVAVKAILDAMDGRVIEDGRLSGWERRQPKRDDGSAERAARWRERNRTQPNAQERPDTDTDTEILSSSLRSEDKSSDRGSDLAPPSVEKPKRDRKPYPEAFEAFWRAYPTTPVMSKQEAGKAWLRLGEDDRAKAGQAVSAFAKHCASNPDYPPVHACRFLSQRRFDGFASATGPQLVPTAPTVFVHADTPEWSEWATHLAALGKPPPKAIQMKAGFGGYFQSASPPPREGIRAA